MMHRHRTEHSPRRPSPHATSIVNYAVGWFLNDPATWSLIRRLWVRVVIGRDRKVRQVPIKPVLHRNGREWRKVFDAIFAKFSHRFIATMGNIKDARWTSYGLSYQALLGSASLGNYGKFAYIYKACVNEHNRYLRREATPPAQLPEDFDFASDGGMRPENLDFRLDFEGVLRRLRPEDASICRLRLVDGRTFQEIGRMLDGLDRSTVKRRFDAALPLIRAALRDYEDCGRPCNSAAPTRP